MSSQPQVSPIVARRVTHLRHGINLSHWFSQVYEKCGYVASHFDSWTTAQDIALIKSMGFDHVRFPIAPEPIMNESDPAQLPAEYIARIDRAVQTLLDHDLAVIIDIHPESKFKKGLSASDANVEAFVSFWEALAGHFSKFDTERVFFEVLNEPEIFNPKRWNEIQNRAAQAIRRSAPEHTIIIGGDEWSQMPMFLLLEPPPDRNLICNFHLYDPAIFTHQGARWAAPWLPQCKGLTYPSDAVFIKNFLPTVSAPDTIREIEKYCEQNWNLASFEAMAAQAAAWGRERGYALSCNEFGVYKVYAPRPSRLLWIRDVASALEKFHISWTMWDYARDFAVVNTTDGKRVPDAGVLAALGLTPENKLGSTTIKAQAPAE